MKAVKLVAAMASLMGSGTFIPFSHKPHPTGHGSRKLWPTGYSTPGFLWRDKGKVRFQPAEPSHPYDGTRAGRRRQWKAEAKGSPGLDRKGWFRYTRRDPPFTWAEFNAAAAQPA